MTLKTRSALITQANTDLPDNETRSISPADVRNIVKDIIDSFISKKGDSGIAGQLSYLSEYSFDDAKQIIHKGYADSIVIGDHYFVGSESADDSVRLHYDIPTKQLIAQIRVSGVWTNGNVVCEFP